MPLPRTWPCTWPCTCHALAMHLPCTCHALATPLPCSCHALAMHLPCRCHAVAMQLPYSCHAVAIPLPGICQGIAMHFVLVVLLLPARHYTTLRYTTSTRITTTLLRYDTLLQLPPLPLPQLCLFSRPPAHTRSFSPSEARRAAAERARASGRAAGVLATKVELTVD